MMNQKHTVTVPLGIITHRGDRVRFMRQEWTVLDWHEDFTGTDDWLELQNDQGEKEEAWSSQVEKA